MIDWRFTVSYLVLGAGILALEMFAIFRKERGDTISEHIWVVLRKAPVLWFVLFGFLGWLGVHLLGFGIVDNWIGGW